jgi:hypothetical protein
MSDEVIGRVSRFLEKRGVSNACPFCAQSAWTVVNDGFADPALVMVRRDQAFSVPPPALPTYTLVCNNCAFVRSHAKLMIDRDQ